MTAVTDTHRRLLYAHTQGEACCSSVLQQRMQWSVTLTDAVTADAIKAGWLLALPGERFGGVRYRSIIRPACCHGGYRPPDRHERAAPHSVRNALLKHHRRIRLEANA
jgi:hypothetical protein